MQPMPAGTHPSGFEVEWQLAEDTGPVIDLSTDERDAEAVLPEDVYPLPVGFVAAWAPRK